MEYKKNNKDNSVIAVMPIKEDSNTLLSYLDKKELYRPALERMAEKRRREWLAVRVLLKELVSEEKMIEYLPSGKPFLNDGSWNISISHTKDYAAIILDKRNKVAIDIEHISPRINKIRSRFMNVREEENLSVENELIHLLLHWSAKESLYKLLDDERIEFRTQLLIDPFEPRINEWSEFTAKAKEEEYTIHYYVNEYYVLTHTCRSQEKAK